MLISYGRALFISKRLNENCTRRYILQLLYNIIISKISKIRQKIKVESIVRKEQAITPVSYRKTLHNFKTIKWKL